jgi:YfiH family protein
MTDYSLKFLKKKPSKKYFELNQTHSNEIKSIQEIKKSATPLNGDGIFWKDKDLNFNDSVAIKTADCLSILIHNNHSHYLIHAGWKGLQRGILNKIEHFDEAIFSPSIHSCCFEVTSEFRGYFPNSPNFFKKNNSLYFDLQSEAVNQLKNISPDSKIKTNKKCTYCASENFHSFRRDKTKQRNYTLVTKL